MEKILKVTEIHFIKYMDDTKAKRCRERLLLESQESQDVYLDPEETSHRCKTRGTWTHHHAA